MITNLLPPSKLRTCDIRVANIVIISDTRKIFIKKLSGGSFAKSIYINNLDKERLINASC